MPCCKECKYFEMKGEVMSKLDERPQCDALHNTRLSSAIPIKKIEGCNKGRTAAL